MAVAVDGKRVGDFRLKLEGREEEDGESIGVVRPKNGRCWRSGISTLYICTR